jgi:hypothetical protein
MKRFLPALCCLGLCWIVMIALGVTPAHATAEKVCLCHVPPGDSSSAHAICVGQPAVRAHLRHGDTLGVCPVACGGSGGATCPAGQFCKLEPGLCSEEDKGVCTQEPRTCTEIFGPVCGCDGKTYPNACFADAAGVSVDRTGACTPAACGGSAEGTCGAGQFCKQDDGACEPDAAGVCTGNPVTCPATLAPVCGCDGTTYSNGCYADVAKVPVQHTGPCETEVACLVNAVWTCPAGQFCKPPQGQCINLGPGVCAPTPQTCPDDLDPVCGCSGLTYLNACVADRADRLGNTVNYAGFCEPRAACGGSDGGTCAAGQFCEPPVGDCAAGAPGSCVPKSPVCIPVLLAVCGCDGRTYENFCTARASGVGVSHYGPCEAPCRAHQTTCGSGEICKRPDGDCARQAEGVCMERPGSCPAVLAPACGCDGITYSNACIADAAGITVVAQGPCVPPLACGGNYGTICGENAFCKHSDGLCGQDAVGICRGVPLLCPPDLNEVCGCDGITYHNACFADVAGVTVDHTGPCMMLQ